MDPAQNAAPNPGSHPLDTYAPLLRLAWVWGVLVTLAVLLRALFRGGGAHADFALFYETIERARTGLPMYGALVTAGRVWLPGPNYNPPHFYVLFAPFGFLPFRAAFVLWTVAGLACGTYAARRTVRALKVRLSDDRWLVGGLVVANAALASTLRAGQLSLILTLPVCLAWIAAREDRWTRAGIWIGVAASMKPFLLIVGVYLLLTRRWRALLAMAIAGAAAVLVGAAAFGWHEVRAWLTVFESPRMDDHFHNASFAAFIVRGFGTDALRMTQVVAGAGALATLGIAVRSRDIDHAWLTLMAGALLWSPLGWIYYGWNLMPPLAALAVRRVMPRLAWGWILLWLWPPYTPGLAAAHPLVAVTIGSVYTWGLVLLWAGEAGVGRSVVSTDENAVG